jgi:hypothetical protein
MIIAAANIVLLLLVMVYLYAEHFASDYAVPTATSQPYLDHPGLLNRHSHQLLRPLP